MRQSSTTPWQNFSACKTVWLERRDRRCWVRCPAAAAAAFLLSLQQSRDCLITFYMSDSHPSLSLSLSPSSSVLSCLMSLSLVSYLTFSLCCHMSFSFLSLFLAPYICLSHVSNLSFSLLFHNSLSLFVVTYLSHSFLFSLFLVSSLRLFLCFPRSLCLIPLFIFPHLSLSLSLFFSCLEIALPLLSPHLFVTSLFLS